ncbi:MAG: hypothetical protein H8E34_11430 [Bacteroidetes bacterium]|nr:hypothetical protein [Bacteroidota bacterium]
MKFIDWNILRQNLKQKLKRIFTKPEQKSYLKKLLDNIEKQDSENKNLPFKIIEIREKGFIVKVCGLRGYISFNHMPWTYNNNIAWNAVFPYLKGKLFFSKIYQIQKNPISIMLNGEIPQFKKPELTEDRMYHGIILNKTNFGAFIDIGYAFNWKNGSLIGLLHKSHFETIEHFEKIEIGEIIKLLFWGYNEKEQVIFGLKPELKEWFTNEIEQLIGTILPVKTIKAPDNNVTYIVKDRFSASLLINKSIYPENRPKIRKAIRNLKDGEIIHCEIISINKPKRTFQLKWNTPSEIEEISSRNITKGNLQSQKTNNIPDTRNTIENCLNTEVVEQLTLIGKTVNVKVIKENKSFGRAKVKYLVEDKYPGNLKISDDFFTFGFSEMKHIEKNLQNGEIINCKVLSVRNNTVNIQWKFNKKELFRFFR